jgi:hypothetical protein
MHRHVGDKHGDRYERRAHLDTGAGIGLMIQIPRCVLREGGG